MNQKNIIKTLPQTTQHSILDPKKNNHQYIGHSIAMPGKSQPHNTHPLKILKNAGIIYALKQETNIFIKASHQQMLKLLHM